MAGASFAILMGGAAITSAIGQASAAKMQAKFQSQQLRMNQQLADLQADDAITRGEKAAQQHAIKVKEIVSSQRAALAAQGIDVDSGTAKQIQEDSYTYGEQDMVTIRNNAFQEAWGYKVNALNMNTQSSFIQLAAKNEARNTLLTGGLQAAGYGVKGYSEFGGGGNNKIDGYSGTTTVNYSNRYGTTA